MRKSLWIIPSLLLFVAIAAPAAKADSMLTYTYSVGLESSPYITWATTPMPPITEMTTIQGIDLASSKVGSGFPPVASVTLDETDTGYIETSFGPNPDAIGAHTSNAYDAVDYLTPGTYTHTFANSPGFAEILTVARVPEPATSSLMLIGIWLLGLVMRKRIAQGLPSAT